MLNYENRIDGLTLLTNYGRLEVGGYFDNDEELRLKTEDGDTIWLDEDEAKALYEHLGAVLGHVEDPAEIEEEDEDAAEPDMATILGPDSFRAAVALSLAAEIAEGLKAPFTSGPSAQTVMDLADFILAEGDEDEDEAEEAPAETSASFTADTPYGRVDVRVEQSYSRADGGVFVSFIGHADNAHVHLSSEDARIVRDTITANIG